MNLELTPDSPLVDSFYRKQELLKEGDPRHKEIRPYVVALGGGMKGVRGSGALAGLEVLGLSHVPDLYLGISTGATPIPYVLSLDAKHAAWLYYNQCPMHGFRRWRRFRKLTNTELIEWFYYAPHSHADLSVATVSRPEFYVTLTDYETGDGFLANAKTAHPSMTRAIKGSIFTPGTSGIDIPVINGRRVVDGYLALPFPIIEAVKLFPEPPTDVLVIANATKSEFFSKKSSLRAILYKRIYLRGPYRHLRSVFEKQPQRFKEGWDAFRHLPMRKAILFAPEDGVGALTMNSQKLKRAAEMSFNATVKAFGVSPETSTIFE